MARMILRCRDAEMIGPFCDYVTGAETFDEAIRELRVHARTHHEKDISDEEVEKLRELVGKEETKTR